MITEYHAKYYAHEIVKHHGANDVELVKKRRRLRNKLDDVEDAIEDKARKMRDELQSHLKQKVSTSDLFTIRYSVT